MLAMVIAESFADEGRAAFPLYTRTLRPRQSRIIVVQPPPPPPTLAQEQRPKEALVEKQLSQEELRREQVRAEHNAQVTNVVPVEQRTLTQDELTLDQLRAEQKARENELGSFTHMYGTSDLYGGLYHR